MVIGATADPSVDQLPLYLGPVCVDPDDPNRCYVANVSPWDGSRPRLGYIPRERFEEECEQGYWQRLEHPTPFAWDHRLLALEPDQAPSYLRDEQAYAEVERRGKAALASVADDIERDALTHCTHERLWYAVRALGDDPLPLLTAFKGGVGRTQLLANVAIGLANRGLDLVLMDMDLESPGLHTYFHPPAGDQETPRLCDQDLAETPGLIDILTDHIHGHHEPPDIENLLLPLAHPNLRPDKGRIRLLPPGRLDAQYPQCVSDLSWERFNQEAHGYAYMEYLRDRPGEADYSARHRLILGVSYTKSMTALPRPSRPRSCTISKSTIVSSAAISSPIRTWNPPATSTTRGPSTVNI